MGQSRRPTHRLGAVAAIVALAGSVLATGAAFAQDELRAAARGLPCV